MEPEVEALKNLLDENNVEYKVLTHERAYTSEQAAKMRGVPLSSGVKAMVVKSEKGFFLILVPGDKKIDFDRLRQKIGKASLASAEDVFRVTGCEVGSVHPFGNLFGLQVLMDRHILDNPTVNFNAGLHEISINMSSRDMAEIIKPEIGDYSK
ncbi:MAG TPA: hypothetical protein HA230_02920 [Candidatus Aenigmarchaeota archaeon]|nr:hypothetical protein [Candidatus Aenigmarchaeota archaeon]